MLKQVRGALKGVGAWFIVVLLILAFALWGVPELRQFTGTAAVTIGDDQFSSQYVQTEFNRTVQIRRQESGGDFTRDDAIAAGLQEQVIQTIATRSALNQYTKKLGLAMPREIVRDYLQNNESFHNSATGRFDRFILESILAQNNLPVAEFEQRIAEQLMSEQLIGALASNGPAPTALSNALLLRDSERRRIAYLTVTNDMAGVPAEPTPTDLETFYQGNESVFTAPEYRTFDLLVMGPGQFSEGLTAPEEELLRLYEANKVRLYDQPEKRTLYQITYETQAEAQAAVAALRQGKPFENLASERSLNLEAVTFPEALKRDILDPSVAEAAFADGLEEGAILEPIQSLFGWTIVQIAGVSAPESKSFEEVRSDIEADYLANDTRRSLLNAIDEIEEERDTGASLAAAAEAAGFEIQTFGPVDRYSFGPGGAIIDNIPGEVFAEAFRLDEGEESEALDLADNSGYYFVSMQEITPPTLIPFEDVRDDVETRWRQQEREQRISSTVNSIRESIEGGESLEQTALTFDRAPIDTVIDPRFENNVISTDFTDQIFSADLLALVSGPTALGQAQVVAEIRDITFATNTITPDQEAIYRQYLGYQLDQELLESFVTSIREDYGVNVNRAQLDALFGEAQ